MAVTGLWILTGGISGINRGDVLVIISSVVYSVYIIYTDKYVKKDAVLLSLVFHQYWMIGIMGAVVSLISGQSFAVTSHKALYSILYLAFFPTLIAIFLQAWAQKKISPVKTALILSLTPAAAAVFSWTVGGEIFNFKSLTGGVVIIAAVLISEFSKLKIKAIKE
jgi:drug/metabolite transporter (DMT)-like permease